MTSSFLILPFAFLLLPFFAFSRFLLRKKLFVSNGALWQFRPFPIKD